MNKQACLALLKPKVWFRLAVLCVYFAACLASSLIEELILRDDGDTQPRHPLDTTEGVAMAV